MFTSGLLLIVSYLLFKYTVQWIQYYNQTDPRMPNSIWRYTCDYKVIGIREIKDFIEKKTSFKEMKLNIVIKTRQYAKRQRTWSRGQMSDWQKFDPNGLLKFIKKL